MVKAEGTSRHEDYVEKLCSKIRNNYDLVRKHVIIYKKTKKRERITAEIDILACKKNYCDIYEVKCSYRKAKAKQQLNKIKELLKPKEIKNIFFFCGEAEKLEHINKKKVVRRKKKAAPKKRKAAKRKPAKRKKRK